MLFDIDGTINPNVGVLLKLLTAIKQIIPAEITRNLRLPKAFLKQQKHMLPIAGQRTWQYCRHRTLIPNCLALRPYLSKTLSNRNTNCIAAIIVGSKPMNISWRLWTGDMRIATARPKRWFRY